MLAISAVFFVVDPIGVVPAFIAMTASDDSVKREEMARRACILATGLLMLFAVAGAAIFHLFGVTLPAFKIAGGIFLMLTAFDLSRAQKARTRTSPEEESESAAKEDIAIVPLATPLLAGPGAIATVMVLVSRTHHTWQIAVVLASIGATMIASYVMLRAADRIARVLGATGINVLNRLIGLLLGAVAVQFIVDGAREAMK